MTQHCRSWSDIEESVSSTGVGRREMSGITVGLVQVSIPAGTKAPSHSHDFEQFVQVIAGSGTPVIEQGRVEFGPCSVSHFLAGIEHAAEFRTDTVLVEETNLSH